MAEITNVVIGIQARSTSHRFPRKIFETIGGKPMIQHVIDAARSAARYFNEYGVRSQQQVMVALCVPAGDESVGIYRRQLTVIEGDEFNVLSRYKALSDKLHADYIIRLTADCPLLVDSLILKVVKTTLLGGFDYLSNVDETLRNSTDGLDVEAISQEMLNWLDQNATEAHDREHVTTLARRSPPSWARVGIYHHQYPLSEDKLSVDTLEDLDRVREFYDKRDRKFKESVKRYGKQNVFSF